MHFSRNRLGRGWACAALLAVVTAWDAAGADPSAPAAGENMALGKRYTLQPKGNYTYCTDPDDKVQLTDGQSTKGYFWTQKGTVGWTHAPFAAITVDLTHVEPIGAVALTTAAGRANVQWPAEIHVQVSDDGKVFREQGELIALDRQHQGPLPNDYAIRRLLGPLSTRARYVRFVMIPLPGSAYLFVDEVEVLRGPKDLLDRAPEGEPIDDLASFVRRGAIRRGVEGRRRADLDGLAAHLVASLPDASARRPLEDRLAEVRKELLAAPVPAESGFRAILPFDTPHARLFGLQAELWRQLGRARLSAWPAVAWDPLDEFTLPPDQAAGGAGVSGGAAGTARLAVHSMLGEYRSAAINLANAGPGPMLVRIGFRDLPGAPVPPYITVHEVQWTDTSLGRPIAAALPVAQRDEDAWLVQVAPGLVRQVWMTFHVQDVPAKAYPGRVVIQAAGVPSIEMPLELRVWPMRFPDRPSLRLGGWDYTDALGRGVTAQNRDELVRHLRERFVSCPWASGGTMLKCKFTGDRPDVALDTERFDAWIALWPQAERYMVFLAVGDALGGRRMGTPEFDRYVAAWITAWVAHLREKGIEPRRLGVLLLDEPHEGKDFMRIVHWAKAIRAAQPEVVIWEDPTWRDPTKAPPEVFAVCDILCPNRPMWLSQGKSFAEFFLRQQREGRALDFYSCSGPAKLLDPYSYHRLQAWQCWKIGAQGTSFWSFSDNSGVSSWNEYLAKSGPYTPLFLDEKTVVAGKHMEAVRESVEDYQTLLMLREALAQAQGAGRRGSAVDRAAKCLAQAADEVLVDQGVEQIQWSTPKDRTRADTVRVRLLETLDALSRPEGH